MPFQTSEDTDRIPQLILYSSPWMEASGERGIGPSRNDGRQTRISETSREAPTFGGGKSLCRSTIPLDAATHFMKIKVFNKQPVRTVALVFDEGGRGCDGTAPLRRRAESHRCELYWDRSIVTGDGWLFRLREA
jgi:hypothetical protein